MTIIPGDMRYKPITGFEDLYLVSTAPPMKQSEVAEIREAYLALEHVLADDVPDEPYYRLLHAVKPMLKKFASHEVWPAYAAHIQLWALTTARAINKPLS